MNFRSCAVLTIIECMKAVSLLLVFSLVILTSCSSGKKTTEDSHTYYEVLSVIDGETVDLEDLGRVLLIGVNAPNIADGKKPAQRFARDSAQFLTRLVLHEKVRVEYDEEKVHKQSKKTLAYIYLQDGTFVNEEIIKNGYAAVSKRSRFKYEDQFKALEKEAKDFKRGIWNKP